MITKKQTAKETLHYFVGFSVDLTYRVALIRVSPGAIQVYSIGFTFGSLWHHCEVAFGVFVGSLCGHSAVTLRSLWGHSGIILGSSWVHFWEYSGSTLGSLWTVFGVTLG